MAARNLRRVEYTVGFSAAAATIVLAVTGEWPFVDVQPATSVVEVLFRDRTTLGFVRAAVLMVALYGIASIPALIAAGRWAKGVGTAGVVADDRVREAGSALASAADGIALLEQEKADLVAENRALWVLLEERVPPD